MISVFEHIEYLLTSHDCIIVPGLGAFITQQSKPHVAEGIITPPQRTYSFNAQIKHNDGLLSTSLMRRHKLSFNQATSLISSCVSAFLAQTARYPEVPFGRIGFFRKSNQNQLEFHPFTNKKRCDDFYALTPVELVSLKQLKQNKQDKAISAFRAFIARTSRISRTAASIAVLIALTLLLSTPIVTNHTTQSYAALSIDNVTKPKAADIPYSLAANTEDGANVSTQEKQVEESKYHLIISAWNSREQAQQFILSHPEMKLSIYEKNGKYLISAAKGNNYSELMYKMHELPSPYNDSWIAD